MVLVQSQGILQQLGGKLPGQMLALLRREANGGYASSAPGRVLGQFGCSTLGKVVMLRAEGFAVGAIAVFTAMLVKPGAADVERCAGFATVILVLLAAGPIGAVQPFHHGRRQGGGGQQY